MSGIEGLYVGLAVAGASVVAGFISAAIAVVLYHATPWILDRVEVVDYALAFVFGIVMALALVGCAGRVQYKGPHWWNCRNVVCHQLSSLDGDAVYDTKTKSCECWIEDARHLPQWIVIK